MPERPTDWQAYGIALLHQELPVTPGPIRRFADTGEIGPGLPDAFLQAQDGAHIEDDLDEWTGLDRLIEHVRSVGYRLPVDGWPAPP
ncbi:hypothetical protein ACFVFH_24240 [Streptomyces sp. NPDC057697]|uniref:hypothetical protein n=1 Tax=Streptomyces sp. NPDC057697 TaxID=3346219 RepID=UPI003687215F